MVELKRWVAKDATDHGQLIDDRDLTNDAIFDRLENDVQFRSIATFLLQQYGYLVPQVNPNSEIGKQQELMIQERIKWITQEEGEARAQEHQQFTQVLQKARSCQQGVQTDCVTPSPQSNTGRISEQQQPGAEPQIPLRSNPIGPYLPTGRIKTPILSSALS